MVYEAKRRAREKGIPFQIDWKTLVIPDICPVLEIRLQKGKRGLATSGSPSLDCFDPSKGYVPGNYFVISTLANRIKNNATTAQVVAVAKWMQKIERELEVINQ